MPNSFDEIPKAFNAHIHSITMCLQMVVELYKYIAV